MLQPPFACKSLKANPLNKRISIRPSICIGLCISLFLLPVSWVFAWLAAVVIHEAGHLLTMRIMNIPIRSISIDLKGAIIEAGYFSPAEEFICALAGPAAGLGCLLVADHFPLLAVCGFVQSAYNLLPFPDYDGGRVLMLTLSRFLTRNKAEAVYRLIILTASVLLLLFGLFTWFILHLGPMFLFVCIIPVVKSSAIKIPCKQSKQIVQ